MHVVLNVNRNLPTFLLRWPFYSILPQWTSLKAEVRETTKNSPSFRSSFWVPSSRTFLRRKLWFSICTLCREESCDEVVKWKVRVQTFSRQWYVKLFRQKVFHGLSVQFWVKSDSYSCLDWVPCHSWVLLISLPQTWGYFYQQRSFQSSGAEERPWARSRTMMSSTDKRALKLNIVRQNYMSPLMFRLWFCVNLPIMSDVSQRLTWCVLDSETDVMLDHSHYSTATKSWILAGIDPRYSFPSLSSLPRTTSFGIPKTASRHFSPESSSKTLSFIKNQRHLALVDWKVLNASLEQSPKQGLG